MNKFAKLFNNVQKYNQIVLILWQQPENDDPQITIFWEPENAGVCTINLGFTGPDAWTIAEKKFNQMSLKEMISAISTVTGTTICCH